MKGVEDHIMKHASHDSPPINPAIFNAGVDTTLGKSFALTFTTGNFKSIQLSAEALDKARRLFDSPEAAKSDKPSQSSVSHIPSAESLQKAQKLFDSPIHKFAKEEKATDEVDKKALRKDIPISVRASVIKHNRGELASGSGIHPKIVTIGSKINENCSKRKPVEAEVKVEKRKKNEVKKQQMGLLEINQFRPLKGFCNSTGLLVKAENADSFVFKCNCYTGGCSCGSRGMDWEDFYDILIESGMNVSKEWVQRHYRLVIWKYASYERRVPALSGVFTVAKVLENLKKRYGEEIVANKRSVLKRILDSDELPSKRMVLCVGVVKYLGSVFSVELIDGWNSIFAEFTCESLFFPLLQRKIIYQGLKIEVFGCTLHELKLVIPYNSCRRAAWDRNLGEVPTVFPFPVSIASLKESGGIIGRVSGYISRIYPLLFIENSCVKSRFNVSDPSSCFFECLIKDGLVDCSKKKSASALLKIKSNANEIYENIKLGYLVHFYFLSPSKSKGSKISLNFNSKSRVVYTKKERRDVVKPRKVVDNKCKISKEVDAVGIVTSVQRTQNNEVWALSLAAVNGNIKVSVHNPSVFGRSLAMIEASSLKSMRIVAFLNVEVQSKKMPLVEVRTTNYTEILHSNFPGYMMQQVLLMKEFNLNSLLAHRQECDHFGCVCGL